MNKYAGWEIESTIKAPPILCRGKTSAPTDIDTKISINTKGKSKHGKKNFISEYFKRRKIV